MESFNTHPVLMRQLARERHAELRQASARRRAAGGAGLRRFSRSHRT